MRTIFSHAGCTKTVRTRGKLLTESEYRVVIGEHLRAIFDYLFALAWILFFQVSYLNCVNVRLSFLNYAYSRNKGVRCMFEYDNISL
jgi:hypothetical protein